MMNNYNPYEVPDNFFEATCNRAISKYRCRRRAFRIGIATVAAVALFLIVPLFANRTVNIGQQETESLVNNLAEMYDYDIFLQVNFID